MRVEWYILDKITGIFFQNYVTSYGSYKYAEEYIISNYPHLIDHIIIAPRIVEE